MFTLRLPFLIVVLLWIALPSLCAVHDHQELHDTTDQVETIPGGIRVQDEDSLYKIVRSVLDTRPEVAINFAVPRLKSAIANGQVERKAKAYWLLGDYSVRNRQYLNAFLQYHAAISNFRILRDTAALIRIYDNIGFINLTLGDCDVAIKNYQIAYRLAFQSHDIIQQGMQTFHQAMSYQRKRDFGKADFFFTKAILLFQSGDYREEKIHALTEKGNTYLIQGKNDEALAFFTRLLKISDSLGISRYHGLIYTRIGHIYSLRNDHRKSLEMNRKSLEYRIRCRSAVEIHSSLINIAGDFFQLDQKDSAMKYFSAGMAESKRYNQVSLLVNGYRHLYQYYSKKGDYLLARKYFDQYSSLKDLIDLERYSADKRNFKPQQALLQEIESGVRLKKQNQIQALILKNQQYPILISAFLIVITFIILGFLIVVFVLNHSNRKKVQNINRQLQETKLERAEKMVRITEEVNKFEFLSENSVDLILHLDADLKLVYVSPVITTQYLYDPDELNHKHFFTLLIHPDYHRYIDQYIREMKSKRKEKYFVSLAMRKDKSSFYVEAFANPVFDQATGEFRGVVAVLRDINNRYEREEKIKEGMKQKENLLKEIHHRVKNNFAILVSLINMQIAQHQDPTLRASLTNLQLRIRSMSLVHEMLYRSEDFEKIAIPEYIRSLSSVVAAAYNRRNIHLEVEVDQGFMNIDTAIPVGLILTEVISNAYLHAFPDNREGKMEIRFSKKNDYGDYRLLLRDNGTGLPENFELSKVQTIGLQIVQLLCKQIDSTLEILRDGGTGYLMDFSVVRN